MDKNVTDYLPERVRPYAKFVMALLGGAVVVAIAVAPDGVTLQEALMIVGGALGVGLPVYGARNG